MYYIENYFGISYIEAFQPITYIPTLPIRVKLKNSEKVIFPCGYIKGYYTRYIAQLITSIKSTLVVLYPHSV